MIIHFLLDALFDTIHQWTGMPCRLIELLPRHVIQKPGLFLYFPKRASMAPKLRAFIMVARDVAKNSANPV
jgi:hypothetical protein